MLTLLLVGILIGGGTMAWFTAGAEAEPVAFQCGTVEIDVGSYLLEGPDNMNWNPGDCNVVEWDIYNMGTKAVELRVTLGGTWDDENLNGDNITFAVNDDNWVLSSGYFYYMGGPIAAGEYVTLSATVTLDGALTGNEYQGAEYALSGVVEAVQASNDAPSAVWGWCWNNVKGLQ